MISKRGRLRKRSGFTLIELLLVVVVISILASIAIFKVYQTTQSAYRSTLESDLRNLTAAQAMHFGDHISYAASLDNLVPSVQPSDKVTIVIDSASATGWGATATHSSSTYVCRVAVTLQGIGTPSCEI